MASNFVKTLTNTLMKFSLKLVNTGQPKAALIANKAFQSVTMPRQYLTVSVEPY